ncbi:MAG: hypothetical protein IJN67_08805 [Oscillospiraceae bacterium]|nr:hypothetical protein [Oscillospiraceae bacterium]
MKKNTYTLNTLLVAVLTIVLLAAVLVRTFAPRMILPLLDVPNMVLISLAALLLDHYIAPGAKRCYICIPVFSALTFGLLPFAACFVGAGEAVKLGILGGVVFTAATWLFSSMADRLSSGPAAKAAPVVSALGLYLAAQCLMGMF